MNIETTREDELHRDFAITLSEKDYNKHLDSRLKEISPQVRVSGFRPGKVPIKVLRQRFADRLHGEVIEKVVNDITRQLSEEHDLTLAMSPRSEVTDFDPARGLSFSTRFVLAPEISLTDVKKIRLDRYKIDPEPDEIANELERIRSNMRTSKPLTRKRKTKKGDLGIIDFSGSVDGEKFDGGTASDHRLELGSGQFIPGFEDQLVGLNVGDETTVKVTFPEDYGQESLAGKPADFAVTLKDIHDFSLPELDDAMAKQLGLDSLDKLKESVSEQIARGYQHFSDEQLKRDLFDALEEAHEVTVAGEMLESEYAQLEGEYKNARLSHQLSAEEMEQPEEEALQELKVIAERRVRLALVLAAFGRKFGIEVTDEDVRNQMMEEARQYPGREQQFVEFLQNNPEARKQLSSRAHESTIVRVMLEMIKPTEKQVTLEAFQKMQEKQEMPGAKKARARPAAKKTTSAKAAASKAAASKAAPKKPAARKAAPAKPASKKPASKPAAKKPAAAKAAPKTTSPKA